MNIIQSQGSRIKPKEGDVFVYKLLRDPKVYWYGRVVSTKAKIGGLPGGFNLLYFFDFFAATACVPEFLPAKKYLIPPRCTNNQPWLKGYFKTVGNRDFLEGERFPIHQFKDFGENAVIYDENGNVIEERIKGVPVGVYGLDSYQTIDEDIEDKQNRKR